MGTHVKNERVRLLRKMEQLLNKLAENDPETVKEFRSARAALEVYGVAENERYAKIRSTKDAIRAALEFEGKWQVKRELAHKLMEGGFPVDPEFGPHLLVANMNKNIQRGHFACDVDNRIGLIEWVGDKSKE